LENIVDNNLIEFEHLYEEFHNIYSKKYIGTEHLNEFNKKCVSLISKITDININSIKQMFPTLMDENSNNLIRQLSIWEDSDSFSFKIPTIESQSIQSRQIEPNFFSQFTEEGNKMISSSSSSSISSTSQNDDKNIKISQVTPQVTPQVIPTKEGIGGNKSNKNRHRKYLKTKRKNVTKKTKQTKKRKNLKRNKQTKKH
jgi:hypothetical protein